jgi:ParB family chromosome partitioning protein
MKYNLTERHARALLKLASKEERLQIIEKIIKYNLNVERTEQAIEDFIEKNAIKESYRKRSRVFQDVRIFINTINKAVETMQAAGILADASKTQNEEYIEYRVRIPLSK